MHRLLRFLPMAGACAAVGMAPAAAQDGLAGGGPERCISLTRLDKTEVIDDRTIIFLMRGGRIYLNHLSRECPGLKREERFMYSPTSNRLCDIDQVTVLEQWGFGLTRGFTCSLGVFHPISEAELEDLRNPIEGESSGGRGDGEFEVVPVEPPLEDTIEDETETGAGSESGAGTGSGAGNESGAGTGSGAGSESGAGTGN